MNLYGDGLAVAKREEFSNRINLDLGIGSCACGDEEGSLNRKNIEQEKKDESLFFTDAQFHEFYRQILVFNFLTSGCFVPPHLSPIDLIPERCSSILMDSEPERCRRTDGRKWRCSKNVVPHQKYCERHMHRGSRKHVEHISNPQEDNKISHCNSMKCDVEYRRIDNVPTLGNGVLKNENVGCATISTYGNLMRGGTCTESRSENANPSIRNGVVPRFGLSPKSVLHCDAGKIRLVSGRMGVAEAEAEAEAQRCRRTDGKKWQCRRDAVPSQKYCEAHMHRGTKRHKFNPESTTDHGINLNTIPASPHQNSTSSRSDATTITDENISFCLHNS